MALKKITVVFVIFFASCVAPKVNITNAGNGSGQVVPGGKLLATAFQQRSAEYRALCYQAFNVARWRIEQFNRERSPKPKAIMTDIDETLLNNSPYEAHQLLQGKDYDDASWVEWTSKGVADTMPGALHFLQYAAASGIEVFYVTNRGEREREGTLNNLRKFHFPNADSAHLLLKGAVSTKEVRKQWIARTHTIVLLLGDNMNDFSSLFEKKNPDDRARVADDFAAEFGNRFIVLPNPVYGDWEFSLYHFNYGLSPAQKDSAIRASLYSY